MWRSMRAAAEFFAQVEDEYLVAAAFVFGLFMDILDTTIVKRRAATFGRGVSGQHGDNRMGGDRRLRAEPGGRHSCFGTAHPRPPSAHAPPRHSITPSLSQRERVKLCR